jgi:UDP-GlcNAc:undecaprenyl-phosphate GlcNAc-1-phosphate transferase
MVLVGLFDDKFEIRSRVKLLVVIPIASLILTAGGLRIIDWPFSHLIPLPDALNYFFGVGLTVLWTVVVTTAFAILDHMDGLCAGVAAIAAAFFLVIALIEAQYLLAVLASSLIGACLGFLFWNKAPASIFMGDSGALLLGFLISSLGIMLRFFKLTPSTSWMIPVVVLGVPLFDLSLVVFSRIRRGVSPATSGKDHLSHRLSELGLGNRRAVQLVYLLCVVFGVLALILTQVGIRTAILLLLVVIELGIIAIARLENIPFRNPRTPSKR